MPRLVRGAWRLLRTAAIGWSDDELASRGAALAYYTLFSLAPLLLIVISVVGLVFGESAARGEIFGQIEGLLGERSAEAIESVLVALDRPGAGRTGTLVGVAVLLFGATTVFAELQGAMDRIWRSHATAGSGTWSWLRVRLLSLGLVLGIGFLLIVSLVFSAALSALGRWWGEWIGDALRLAELLHAVIGFGVLTAAFAMLFKWMPSTPIAWGDVWFGALTTALLFSLGRSLIGLYIGTSGVVSPFGAAGSLVVLLVWVYWSAQIFLFGVELTRAWACEHGSCRPAEKAPESMPAPG